MKKLFLFDLDGTLVNTLPDISACLNFALEGFGLPAVTQEQCARMVGRGARKLCELALAGSEITDLESLTSSYMRRYARHLTDFAKPYPGIPELLDALEQQGVRCGVITNKPQQQAEPILSTLFGPGRFLAVWGDNGARPPKPDPRLMDAFLKEFGFTPQQTVYVGDSALDIQFAKSAGVFAAGASWGFQDARELEAAGADLMARQASDLLQALTISLQ